MYVLVCLEDYVKEFHKKIKLTHVHMYVCMEAQTHNHAEEILYAVTDIIVKTAWRALEVQIQVFVNSSLSYAQTHSFRQTFFQLQPTSSSQH